MYSEITLIHTSLLIIARGIRLNNAVDIASRIAKKIFITFFREKVSLKVESVKRGNVIEESNLDKSYWKFEAVEK